jgi:hypothetical protein
MYGDGGGLWLQVTSKHARSWIFRYTFRGKPREMGLGSLDTLSLAEARDQATDIAVNRAGWDNAKHAGQWETTLSTYVYPTFGDRPVDQIDVDLVIQVLLPIWKAKTETAKRVRGRIEKVLDYAKVLKLRDGENPARWRGHLENVLPPPSTAAPVKHLPALPYHQVGTFMANLRQKSRISARALEFTILTNLRTGSVRMARQREIDPTEGIWTVNKHGIKPPFSR